MAKGFSKSANQKIAPNKMDRDMPAKKVIAGPDLRANKTKSK